MTQRVPGESVGARYGPKSTPNFSKATGRQRCKAHQMMLRESQRRVLRFERMQTFRVAVERALIGIGPFTRPVAESILEIAYLTMAVDKDLREEEIEAFSMIAAVMLGKRVKSSGAVGKLDGNELRTWLDKFAEDLDRSTLTERLDRAVQRLAGDDAAKRASYRVACLVSMSDLDAHDREFEFDLDLIAALGLTQQDADAILSEVATAVTPDETN